MLKLDLREIPVHYINMADATQKRRRMETILSSLEFSNVTRFEGIKGTNTSTHDSAAAEGCAESHLTLMKKLKPPFIILEDDCIPNQFDPIIKVPKGSDVIYLGISSWGRLDGRSGPFVHCQKVGPNLVRIFNMLSTHAMLFLTQEYCDMCARIARHWMEIANHLDIGYAEIHKYFNVYAFDNPLFKQSSSLGTDQPLTSYPHRQVKAPPTLTTAYGMNEDQGQYLIDFLQYGR